MSQDFEYCMKMLQEMAKRTKADITPFTLEVYRKELNSHGWDKVAKGLNKLFRSLKFFPTIADIEEAMGIREPDEDDKANLIGSEILATAARYGEYRIGEAEKALGPTAWEVVRRMGGWPAVCMTEIDDHGTFRAQARDIARAVSTIPNVKKDQPMIEDGFVGDLLRIAGGGERSEKNTQLNGVNPNSEAF